MNTLYRSVSGIMIAVMVLLAGIAVSGILQPSSAAAKAKPALSKKSVTMTVQTTKALKVKNAKQKVKWTTGDKKIVTFMSKKGKYSQSIILKAGRKAGTCYVKAKIGKKTLKCKVTVKAKMEPRPDPPKPPDSIVEAAARFSVNFLQDSMSLDQNRNLLISPDSIMTAMAMVENGAQGETLEQMEKAMSGQAGTAEAFNEYLQYMNDRLAGSTNILFSSANSIWVKEGALQVKDGFKDINRKYHYATVRERAFDQQTVSEMNTWVKDKTRGMIKDIIDQLDPMDRLVLINAIAFDGEWAEPFEKDYGQVQEDQDFTDADGNKQKVTMLTQNLSNGRCYLEAAGGTGFVKPYKGGEVAFACLLPPEGKSVDDFVLDLDGQKLQEAWYSRSDEYIVDIRLPKFTYDYDMSAGPVLQGLGIERAFTDQADFSGIAEPTVETPGLHIDEVIHKTHIEVSEDGTKAAAATAVTMKANSAAPMEKETRKVYLDRPFVYALMDVETGTPLFLGVVRYATK